MSATIIFSEIGFAERCTMNEDDTPRESLRYAGTSKGA